MTQYDALPTGDGRSKHEIKTLRAAEASVEMDNTWQGLLSEFSDDVPFALWCISFWATDELSFDWHHGPNWWSAILIRLQYEQSSSTRHGKRNNFVS